MQRRKEIPLTRRVTAGERLQVRIEYVATDRRNPGRPFPSQHGSRESRHLGVLLPPCQGKLTQRGSLMTSTRRRLRSELGAGGMRDLHVQMCQIARVLLRGKPCECTVRRSPAVMSQTETQMTRKSVGCRARFGSMKLYP